MANYKQWWTVARNKLNASAPLLTYLLIIMALALDIGTTLIVLGQGWGTEANPIYSVSEWNMTANLALLRGGVCGALIAWTYKRRARLWQAIIILAICIIPVANNLNVIREVIL